MEEIKKYQLPKAYPALDIIKAFQRTADFQKTFNEKWTSESLIRHSRLFGTPTVFSMGAKICRWSRRKKWFFFGKKIWIKDEDVYFSLKPLILKQDYDEIEITINSKFEEFICRFLEKLETTNP